MPNLMVTLTLDPKMYVYKTLVQLNKSMPLIKERLKKHNYFFCIECTKNFNIHYHIYVIPSKEYRNPVYYFTNLFKHRKGEPIIFGFSKVTISSNTQSCIDYIYKDTVTTSQLLDLPITDIIHIKLTEEQQEFLGIKPKTIDKLNKTISFE